MATFLRGEYSGLAVRLDRHEMIAQQERILAEILLEADEEKGRNYGPPPGDERTMRGIPILGSGFGGAIMGTRPDTAIESRRFERSIGKAA
jgi:hypothetical protein